MRFTNPKSVLFCLLVILFTHCAKIDEASELARSPFNVHLKQGSVMLEYRQCVELSYYAEDYDTNESISFAVEGLPSEIRIEHESLRSNGSGVIHLTSLSQTDMNARVKFVFCNGANKCSRDIEIICNAHRSLCFTNGTTAPHYTVTDQERVFEITVADHSGQLSVDPKNRNAKYELQGNTLISYIPRNETDRTIDYVYEFSTNSEDRISLTVHQLSRKDPKNLKRALLELESAGGFDSSNMYSPFGGNKKWDENLDLNEWRGISSARLRHCHLFGLDRKVLHGLDELWKVDLRASVSYIPDSFWDAFAYVGYFRVDMSREQHLPSSLSMKIWHENLEEIHTNGLYVDINGMYGCRSLKTVDVNVQSTELSSRLSEMLSLETLCLRGNITGCIPSDIGKLENLKTFQLRGSTISGSLPDSFYELTNLETFEANYANLSGEISREVKRLKKLGIFSVDHCRFKGTPPEEFGMLPELVLLDLTYNCFSISDLPEMFRYRPLVSGGWAGDEYMANPMLYNVRREQATGEESEWILGTPRWFWERYGECNTYDGTACTLLNGATYYQKHPHYPYADDLEFPAYEYYYDGKDWRHPSYEHPARFYHLVDGVWQYDANWDAMEPVVPADWYSTYGGKIR